MVTASKWYRIHTPACLMAALVTTQPQLGCQPVLSAATSWLQICLCVQFLSAAFAQNPRWSFADTSHECWGDKDVDRVCKFHNLVLHNTKLFYISTDPEEILIPKVEMSWKTDADNLNRWDLQVHVVRPNQLPFEPLATTIEQVKKAILWARSDLNNNMYHMLAEHTPSLHGVICKYFDMCQYAQETPEDDIQIIFVDENLQSAASAYERTISTLWNCLSSRPFLEIHDANTRAKAIVMKSVVIGIGNECRAFHFCSNPEASRGRKPLSPPMVASWRTRMSQCMGVQPTAFAKHNNPRVTIVQRTREYKRSLLNVLDVVRHFRRYQGVRIKVHYMDDLTVAQQARIFSKSDVLIAMHGACTGHMVFLPHNAVYIEVMPYNWVGRHEFEAAYIKDLKAVSNIALLGCDVVSLDHAHLRIETVMRDPIYESLSLQHKVDLFERGSCPGHVGGRDERTGHCELNWWLHSSDAAIEIEKLEHVLPQALNHIRDANFKRQDEFGNVKPLDLQNVLPDD